MTINQFTEKYYLHDSSIEKIDYNADKKILALTIEFCFWMQNWYNKSEPTNGLIRVNFKDVSLFEYDDAGVDRNLSNELDSEIRSAELDADGAIIFVAVEIMDFLDEEEIYYRLKINAASVEVEELERYNL